MNPDRSFRGVSRGINIMLNRTSNGVNNKSWFSLTPILLFVSAYSLMGAYEFFGLEYFKTFYMVLFFIVFVLYIIFEIKEKTDNKSFFYPKLAIVLFCILFASISSVFMLIENGRGPNGYLYIHDGALQTEIATQKLLSGRNFYTEDFSGTVLDSWNDDANPHYFLGERLHDNIAIYHYVYLPVYPILSAPIFLLTKSIFNFYDERLLFYPAFLGALFILYKLVKDREKKLLALTLFGFNPFFLHDLIEGKNDILILFFLLLVAYLLQKKKFVWSSIILALAVFSKQTVWPFVPFYFFYLFFQKKNWRESLIYVWQKTKWGIIVGILIIFPFIIWDVGAFWEDVYLYPSGALGTSYPITGFGLSRFLYRFGAISSIHDYYPFYIWQFVFCVPLALWLIKKQRKNNSISFMLLAYAILLATFWFFSRFFQSNYVVFIYQLLVITYFLGYNEATDEAA